MFKHTYKMQYLGQYHIAVSFCDCHSKLERLIQLRLWPATPISPELVFTFDLMEHVRILILECQVSLHNIAHMLHMISIIHQKEVNIYSYDKLTSIIIF